MTKTEEWIVGYLREKPWTSPTEIGRKYGFSLYGHMEHCFHSGWASGRCLNLVSMNILERNDKGWYRLA